MELVSLVEKMLELNNLKQVEVNGFLRWVEGEIGTKIDNLSGSSKFQEYYNLNFAEFHAILVKNRRKLKEAYNPSARDPKELLAKEFQLSVSKISQLQKRIEQTDQLIDQIVYRLYGLTEDEIKIVEG